MAVGIPRSARGLTLGEHLQEWLEVCRQRLRPKTIESYTLCCRWLESQLAYVPLVRLTPLMVQSAYARLQASGLAARTVFQTHAVLHRALDQALHSGLIKRNPTEVVAAPRSEQREMTALSARQLWALLASSRGSPWYPLWVLMGTAGLRIGRRAPVETPPLARC